MSSISTLLIRNLQDVFGENDPARRRAAIDETYTEDGVFYDPTSGEHRGRDEIDRVAGAIRATHPDFGLFCNGRSQGSPAAPGNPGLGCITPIGVSTKLPPPSGRRGGTAVLNCVESRCTEIP